MAFIYNLTDTWNDVTTTWNGIKLAVSDTGSSSSSKLLNLTISGSSTGSFTVDKSGNLLLSGSVNKITMTAPATGATLTLAEGSTFATSGAHSATFTFTGSTSLTFPTSGTVTALGNTTTGSGSIVLATGPTITLTNATGLPIAGISATGTPSSTTYLRGDGTWSTVSGGGGSGTVTSVGQTFTGGLISVSGSPVTSAGTLALTVAGTSGGVPYFSSSSTWASTGVLTSGALLIGGGAGAGPSATTTGTGVVTALGVNVGSAGAFVVNGGALGTPSSGTLTNATGLPISTGVSGLGTGVATFLATPSSANLASAVTDETGSGSLVFSTAPTFGTNITVGTASSSTGIVNLKGTTSGTVALSVADAAGSWTMKLPTTAGTNGYYLQTDGAGNTTWAAGGGGGGGSPGGSNTQVQYNNSGAFGGAASFTFDGTSIVGIGVASTTSGTLKLYNSASANAISIASGNNASAWTLTLPTSGGTNGYFLQTDGSGNTSWAAAGGSGTVNSGTANQLAYYATSTNAVSGNANATISSGALTLGVAGSAAGSVVLSGSTSGTVTVGVPATAGTTTFTLPSSNGTNNYVLTTNGSGVTSWGQVSLTAGVTGTLPVANGGTGLTTGTSGGVLYYSASGTLASSAALAASSIVLGGGAGVAPATTTTGTGVVTALGVNVGSAGAFVVNGGALGTPSSGALTNCTSVPVNQATGTLPVANGGTGLTSGTSGGVLYYSATGTLASSAALTANALVVGGGAGVAPSTVTTGTGVVTALGVNTGSAGAFVVNGGALGTPSSGTLTNATGLPISTGVSGLGSNVATWLATPSSANLASAVTDETGSGSLVFATSPTLTTPRLAGSSSGYTSFASANSSASNYTVTFPAETMTVGFRNIPAVGTKTTSYTLAVGDVGKYVQVGTSGSITIPDATFAEGDVVSIFNNTTGAITITCTITTAYIAGTDADKATVSLATRGVATILFISGTVCVISGNVS